jgi:hypothetical protein
LVYGNVTILLLGFKYIGVGRGVRGANDPFGKKSLKLTVKFRSPEIFLKIDRENLEFFTKRPPSANPGYAYEVHCIHPLLYLSSYA